MGISVSDLIRLAETVLGCEREKGTDHVRYVLRIEKKIIGRFKFSHSWRKNQQIDGYILGMQAKSMHCSPQTWKMLLEGKMTRADYFGELLAHGVITPEEYAQLMK